MSALAVDAGAGAAGAAGAVVAAALHEGQGGLAAGAVVPLHPAIYLLLQHGCIHPHVRLAQPPHKTQEDLAAVLLPALRVG
jgi:hypothetical protein